MNTLLSTFKNLRNCNVSQETTLDSWLSEIKFGYINKEKINKIRSYSKTDSEYSKLKSKLPCVTFNFSYNKYKKDIYIKNATGLLFIDIDDCTFDINSLDMSFILAYYKSIGGCGYHIIVRVDGLSYDNFKNQYQYVTNLLNISSYCDKYAAKRSQFTVISYDPDIFINYNSSIIDVTSVPSVTNKKIKNIIEKNNVSCDNIEEKIYNEIDYNELLKDIRFNNLSDVIEFDESFEVNWDGWDVVKCYFPMKKIENGKRNNSLSTFCNNLIYLNPTIQFDKLISLMRVFNKRCMKNPLDYSQINSIAKNYMKKIDICGITSTRKIAFNPTEQIYSKEEKLEICRELLAEKRKSDSQYKLYEILEDWNFNQYNKITKEKISKAFPISKKTVDKYWIIFKDYVKGLNEEYNNKK